MNERDIFITALEKPTAEQRSEFLSVACAGDATLRQRVEELLHRHAQTGDFLQVPLVERLAEGVAALEDATEPARDPSSNHQGSDSLGFLCPSDQPGSLGRLGHYEVREVIGSGGMGTVLRAFDERLHRIVAIKVMAAPLATHAASRKRFLREARAAAAVCHDHIVTIHAVEESNDLPYLVMQCVSGLSLQQRIDRDGPLALHEILRIGMQTAAGLAAAHAQGLIHRDIKPANILLENGVERVRITDFGLARAAADASVTQTGIVAGTPQYMSPEQARGEAIDCRTDLFSLGSVLYAMCTGRAPFRASNSMAVLKRVCEDAPSPIREANADVPEWLIALIDKLQAKDPNDRYQSAAEVAELLGQRLAQLQHSTPLPLLSTPKSASPSPGLISRSEVATKRRRRAWAVAATILLILAATFGLAEGTGATKVAVTVIRVFTPGGTLIVESNDPGVKVTVEGDGGLTIIGAGLEEIRLRPGSYKVHADKDGKRVPLEKELVSIAKGGREVVRVKLEAGPAPAIAGSEKGEFVLLGGKGVAERKFDTLAEAVLAASDGDAIEIRGNGPFVSQPVAIKNRALTIRSGEGFRPVIKADPDEPGNDLLSTNAPLVLEGLDFQWLDAKAFAPQSRYSRLVASTGSASRLHVANCRFLMNRREGRHDGMACVFASDAPLCRLRNCQLFICGHGAVWGGTNLGVVSVPNGEFMIDNCQIVGNGVVFRLTDAEPVTVIQKHNTFLGSPTSHLALWPAKEIDAPSGTEDHRPFRMETSANILGGHVQFSQYAALLASEKRLSAEEVEKFLQQWIGWRENRNLYLLPEDSDLLQLVAEMPPGQYTRPPLTAPLKSLADWQHFWGMPELDSLRGPARFQGGDLLTKAGLTPDLLTPDDFRLRPDSAGYRAGPDGKDLGADVDLVGPGAAYERWKKTPEYQEWLKETGQLRTESTKPESQAFVLLTDKGAEVRKFDTLAEAVQGASAGDTIEIRGNGPFASDGVTIGQPLTIRAGEGYMPSIGLSQASADKNIPLLKASGSLVLEGLELRRVGEPVERVEDRQNRFPQLLYVEHGGALHLANCRLVLSLKLPRIGGSPGALIGSRVPTLSLRNCELHSNAATASEWSYTSGNRCSIENCVIAVGSIGFGHIDEGVQNVSIRVSGNTIVGNCLNLTFRSKPNLPEKMEVVPPVHMELSGNVTHWDRTFRKGEFLFVNQYQLKPPYSAKEAESLLPRLVRLAEKQNVYLSGTRMIGLGTDFKSIEGTRGWNLSEWNQLWAQQNTGSVEGDVRFQGGDLVMRGRIAPEKLTAEDFRLRPDSAGYRAGPGGKDLGADVDLVGPGPAYERWKKTPEYEQWLKDTGQLRAEAPKPEARAFVLLGGQGVAERKFDTLAEAVQHAGDGETMEICGNGPFVTKPIVINQRSLIIRAGAGFRPLVMLDPNEPKDYLIRNYAPLVLEGLDLQWVNAATPTPESRGSGLIKSSGPKAQLHAANCRFLMNRRDGANHSLICVDTWDSLATTLRNCQCIVAGHGNVGGTVIQSNYSQIAVDNCLCHGTGVKWQVFQGKPSKVLFSRNTILPLGPVSISLPKQLVLPLGDGSSPPIEVEMSASVVATPVIWINQWRDSLDQKQDLSASAAEFLKRLVAWRGRGNCFLMSEKELVELAVDYNLTPSTPPVKSLYHWKRFWSLGELDAQLAQARFQGGNLAAKGAATPELLTPEDYRLREDSPGHRAGPDGKDLGADVDLVGPGPAYERWKNTPEYQEWRKETKQDSGQ